MLYLGKLLLAGLGYEVGEILGGVLVSVIGLQAPSPPPGADMNQIAAYMLYVTPLIALALAVLSENLSGGFVARWLSLALLLWLADTVSTQLEASLVSTFATRITFRVVSGGVAALVGAGVVAYLFPAPGKDASPWAAVRAFLAQRAPGGWAWRLLVAAVVFMPIYFIFGLMVLPFTRVYYENSMFGLVMPTIDQLLPILATRSLLFLLSCLPILALWRGPRRSLFWRLGLSLFLLVGFTQMLFATWMPLSVRFPHTLEILADEFVYAVALVWLLVPRRPVQS
jgi:hypothetical protein